MARLLNDRSFNLRRGPAKRRPRKRFVLFCEGALTEPEYFRALAGQFDKSIIVIEPLGGVGVPLTIAQRAKEFLRSTGMLKFSRKSVNSYEVGDEVWAVFDRDEHPSYLEAINFCKGSGIGIARSDPCFELWLIMHLVDCDAALNRHEIQKKLAKILPSYKCDGRKSFDAREIIDKIADAEGRAAKQIERRIEEGDELGSPSTTMYELTEAVRAAAQSR